MATSRRTSKQDNAQFVAKTIRRNIRNLREMHGWSLELTAARLTGTRIAPLTLSRMENGERTISALELWALAVVFQVPPQVLFTPWDDSDLGTPDPTTESDIGRFVAAADSATTNGVRDWLLAERYPCYPERITIDASELEGYAKLLLFSNPIYLKKLANQPTPELFEELMEEAVRDVLTPATDTMARVIRETVDILHFNPFPYFEELNSTEDAPYPPSVIEQLETVTPPETWTSETLTRFDELDQILQMAYSEVPSGILGDLAGSETVNTIQAYNEISAEYNKLRFNFMLIKALVKCQVKEDTPVTIDTET